MIIKKRTLRIFSLCFLLATSTLTTSVNATSVNAMIHGQARRGATYSLNSLQKKEDRFGIKALQSNDWFKEKLYQKKLHKGDVIICGFLRTEYGNFNIPNDILNILEEYFNSKPFKNIGKEIEIIVEKVEPTLKKRVEYINDVVAYCEKENERHVQEKRTEVVDDICIIICILLTLPIGIYTLWLALNPHYYDNLLKLLITSILCLGFSLLCLICLLERGFHHHPFEPFECNRYKIAKFSAYVDEDNDIWHKDLDEWIVGYDPKHILLKKLLREERKKRKIKHR